MNAEQSEERVKRLEQKVQELAQQLQQQGQQLQQRDQQIQQDNQQIQQLQERIRPSTLVEYLRLCHEHLSKSISVQTNKTLATKGPLTNVKNKHRPNSLKPWGDYLRQHKETLEALYSMYPSPQPRVFRNCDFVQNLGQQVASKKVASEADIHTFVRETMERPMTEIMEHLQSLPDMCNIFNLSQGFRFENHGNSLSDAPSKDAQMPEAQAPQPSTPLQPRNSRASNTESNLKPQPDQFCIYTTVGGVEKVALIAEFKPPHKLTLEQLRCYLGPDRHEVDLDKFINRIMLPSRDDQDARDQYEAEENVATTIVQNFSYMVRSETQYGYICTGEALVFLHIKLEDDMKTAYYYLAEPNAEDPGAEGSMQDTNSNPLIALHRTTLSQLITFSIHALQSAKENKSWRARILPKLKIWERSDQSVLDQIAPTPTTAGKSSVDYQPNQVASPPSPTDLRPSSRKRPRKGCGRRSKPTPRDRPDSPPPPGGSSRSKYLTRYAAAKSTQTQRSPSPGAAGSSSHGNRNQNHAYCTQLCLQGLARGGQLDKHCPNVSKHCEEGYQGDRHQLSGEKFRVLIEAQLRRSRGDDFQWLGVQGARGALFKVTLTSHGYTIVAKGTVWGYVKHLRHEAEVYRRLAPIQGTYVPVFLGSLDLDYEFYFRDGIRIVHMMLLSWSGEPLATKDVEGTDKDTLASHIIRAVTAIHEAGVVQRDMRMPNLLWSEEMKRVIVIDFERANLAKATTRQALSSMSPNKKRKRHGGTKEEDKDDVVYEIKKDPELRFRAKMDLSAARDMFRPGCELFYESFL